MTNPKTLQDRWRSLDGQRSSVLDRAHEAASFTIPRLFADRYFDGSVDTIGLPELYSTRPGTNVMKLAAMMTSALIPSNDVPPFEFMLTPELNEEKKEELRDAVQKVERLTLDTIQSSNFRNSLFTSLQHAGVMGDSLIYQTSLTSFKVYHPSQFILRRDGDGNIKEYWTLDWVVTELLGDDLKNLNAGRPTAQRGEHEPLITRVCYKDDEWVVDREFRGVMYDKDKTYDELPYYHIGWTPVAGEDSSRSIVEENMGTIRSLELVSKALAEGIAAGSEGRIIVNSAGPTTEDDIGDTNWSIISARPEDLSTFQPNVSGSVGIALEAVRYYSQVLDEAFLATSAGDLRGERVTAFQTNQVVNEKAQALGGVLAGIEQNLERMVRRTLSILIKEKKVIPEFGELITDGGMKIVISSGLDALGRQMDVLRLQNLIEVAFGTGDPEMMGVLNRTNIMQGLARATGLDMEQYTFNDEQIAEKAAAQQAQQQQQQAQQQAIQSAGSIAEQQLGQA